MPLYVYRAKDAAQACDLCSECFEVLQRLDAPRLKHCPQCGEPVEKQATTAAMHRSQGAAELRNLGLARLERRSDGNYENVSAQEGHQRVGSLDSFAKDLSKGPKPIISD